MKQVEHEHSIFDDGYIHERGVTQVALLHGLEHYRWLIFSDDFKVLGQIGQIKFGGWSLPQTLFCLIKAVVLGRSVGRAPSNTQMNHLVSGERLKSSET